jgi:hypothetical protein
MEITPPNSSLNPPAIMILGCNPEIQHIAAIFIGMGCWVRTGDRSYSLQLNKSSRGELVTLMIVLCEL